MYGIAALMCGPRLLCLARLDRLHLLQLAVGGAVPRSADGPPKVGAVAAGVQLGCRWSARVKGRIAYCGAAGLQFVLCIPGRCFLKLKF